MEAKAIKRLYYSIAEVSRITGLKPYVLRFWETEFGDLKPAKNKAGNRIYRKNDIRLIFQIKKLLYQEKYTIEGAKQRLRKMRHKPGANEQLSLLELKKEDLIFDIKTDLEELLKFLQDGDEDERGVAQPG